MCLLGTTKIGFICWVREFLSGTVRVDLWACWGRLCSSFTFFFFSLFAGLQHQGIFRVSGSQLEVNDIKNSFERGTKYGSCWMSELSLPLFQEATSWVWPTWIYGHFWLTYSLVCVQGNDPLTDEENNHDINSVAGVLKLYFRGLENPLFPKERFNDLLACISKNTHTHTLVLFWVQLSVVHHAPWFLKVKTAFFFHSKAKLISLRWILSSASQMNPHHKWKAPFPHCVQFLWGCSLDYHPFKRGHLAWLLPLTPDSSDAMHHTALR